jgi:glycerophosphoryl diester phosphodiesterase
MLRYLKGILLILFLYSCQANPTRQKEEVTLPQFNAEAFENQGLRSFFAWRSDRIPLISAHRGGPYPGYPENAIETFQHVIDAMPAIIECDIAMTKDSVLIMMHDNTLDRTTTGSGLVAEQTWADLKALSLKDNDGTPTNFKIPTLDEVLEWGKGKALFTLDVKRGVPFEMVVAAVEKHQMEHYAAIISYNANDALKIYQLNDQLMISVSMGDSVSYAAHKAMGIPDDNMIAFVGVREPEKSLYEMLHAKGISTILGVLGNLDRKALAEGDDLYRGFVERGADVLATDRPLEAWKVIEQKWPESSEQYKFIKK